MAEAQLEAGPQGTLPSETHSRHSCLLHSAELYIVDPALISSSCWPFIQSLPAPAFWTLLWCLSHVVCCRNSRNKGLEGTAGEDLDNRAAVGTVLENAGAFILIYRHNSTMSTWTLVGLTTTVLQGDKC